VPIWYCHPNLESLRTAVGGTLVTHLGIEFVAVTDDQLTARMPVDERTRQPYGILHGGASVALAETLGSAASALCVDPDRQRVNGIEINANHIRAVSDGWVHGICRPLHLGRSTHVWDIRLRDDGGCLVCVARLTVAVLKRKQESQ
jgi:1,4-dihydroxy-2-naphthoyl-CoA hydrolase